MLGWGYGYGMNMKPFVKPQRKLFSVLLFLATIYVAFCSNGLTLLRSVEAAVGVNRQINFQGKMVNKVDGTNIADGNYSFTFKFYDAATAGTQLPSGAAWTETQSLAVTSGIFRASLGSVTSIPTTLDFNSDSIYLDITFNGEVFSTRVRMTAVPYAFNAEKVAGLTVTNTTGTLTIPNAKTVSFADAFTTSGAFPLTLTSTATTNATLPAGTITLVDLASAQTLTTKTIGSTGLVYSGAATDITTGTNEALTIIPNGSGDLVLNTDTDTNLQITATAVPTVDQVAITNAGFGTTTAGVNGLSINYVGGAGAIEAAGARIDLTPGGTTGSTWSGLRVVANATGALTGVTENGLKIEGPTTPGAGTENGVNIAGGWDNGINFTSTTIATDINLQNGETIDNDVNDQINLNLGTAGTLLLTGGQTLSTNQATFNLINTTATTVNFAGAATTLNIGPGSTTATTINLAGGSGATGCTVLGASGNLTCSGTITSSATSGDMGWWDRTGTTLSPINAGDAITTSGTISTSGTGTITSAGLLTASNGFTMTTGALNLTSTSGTVNLTLGSSLTAFNVNSGLFDIDTTNSRVGIGTSVPNAKLQVEGGAGINGLIAANSGLTAQNIGRYTPANNFASGLNMTTVAGNTGGTHTADGKFVFNNASTGWSGGFVSANSYARYADRTLEWVVDTSNAGVSTAQADHMMMGWGDGALTAGSNYTNLPYAIYFNKAIAGTYTLHVYEDGTSRTQIATVTWGDVIRAKIVLKATGADYYYKVNDGPWILGYASTYSTESPLYPSIAMYGGRFTVHSIHVYDEERSLAYDNTKIGIGDVTPDAKLEILSTTEQLRLTHTDNTVDSRFTVDTSGNLTIDNTGTKTVIADDLQVTGNDILDSAAVSRLTLGATTTLTNTTTTLSGTTTITASSLATLTTAATLGMASTTTLNCGDCIDFDDMKDVLTIDAATDINLGANLLSIDLDSTGDFQIRDVATAVATFADDGSITFAPTAASDFIVNQAAGTNLQIKATAAPTVDQLVVDNTGFPNMTAGVAGLQVTYVGGAAAVEASAQRIDFTAGTLTGGTWNGQRIDLVTAPIAGVTVNLFKAEPLATGGAGTYNILNAGTITTPGAGGEYVVNVGTGYDDILRYNNTQIISGSGILQSAGLSGTYSNALTLSSATNAITAGTLTATGGTINNTSVGATTRSTGAFTTLAANSTITFSALTASRALFLDGSSNVVASGASSALLNSLTDETGTGVAVFGTSPAITTSLTTPSASFDLINTTATTVNFAGAATTLNIGPGSTTATTINLAGGSGATGCTVLGASGNLTCSGTITSSATSGDMGWWDRTGTTLSPINAGDAITTSGNISTSGTGTITSAGLLTASNGFTMTTGALNLTSTSGTVNLTLGSSTQSSTATTGTGFLYNANSLTTGIAQNLSSTSITTGNLLRLTQNTSAFSGTGLYMDLASGSGTFTGNYLDLRSNGTQLLRINSNGGIVGNPTLTTAANLHSLAATNTSQTANTVSVVDIDSNETAIVTTSTGGTDEALDATHEGFKFNSGSFNNIGGATIRIKKTLNAAGTGYVTAYLYSDVAGSPGSNLATGSSIYASRLTTSYANQHFSLNANLTTNTDYWIVLLRTSLNGDDIYFDTTTGGTNEWANFNGSVWTVETGKKGYYSVFTEGARGIYSNAYQAEGVYGNSTNGQGVRGSSINGYGIYGTSSNSYGALFSSGDGIYNTVTDSNANAITNFTTDQRTGIRYNDLQYNTNFTGTDIWLDSGSQVYATYYYTYDGASYTDRTTTAAQTGGSAYTVIGDTNDFFYFGRSSNTTAYRNFFFDLANTPALSGVTWQYASSRDGVTGDCNGWTNFTPTIDETEGLTRDGLVSLAGFTPVQCKVNSTDQYFWRVSATSVTTGPTATISSFGAFGGYYARWFNAGQEKFRMDYDGNSYFGGRIFPGDSDEAGIQTTRYLYDTGTNIGVSTDLQVNGNDILDSTAVSRLTLGATTTLTNTTTTFSGTTTITASSLATLTTAATLGMASTTTLNCGDCIDFDDMKDVLTIDAATDINLGANLLSIDLDSTGDFQIRDVATAVATFADDGSITFAPTAGSDFIVNQAAGTNLQVKATAAPTVDQLVVDNTGFPNMTAGVAGLQVTYVGGAAAVEASAQRIDFTAGTTTGGTWNGQRIDLVTAPATGVTVNLFKAEPLTTGGAGTYNILSAGTITTPGAGGEYVVNVGTGYDDILRYNNAQIISGTGILQSAGLSGTYSNALTLSSATNAITAGTLTATGGTINNTSVGATTPSTGAFTTLSSTGTTTIGDALADTVTVNAASWTFANDTNFVLSGGINGLSLDTATLSIDATNDRVGIGTSTPLAQLNVSGSGNADPLLYTAGAMAIHDTRAVANQPGGMLYLGGTYTGTTLTTFGGIRAIKSNTTDGNFDGQLEFFTRAHGDSTWTGDQRMVITSTGNVGIGTTAPANLLTVNQTGNATAATSTTYGFALTNAATVNLTVGSDATYTYLQSWSKPLQLNNQGNNIYTNVGGGNFGVGTVSISANTKLDVNGNLTVQGTSADSTSSIYATNINGAVLAIGDPISAQTFTNGLGIKFYDQGTAHASLRYLPSSNRIDFCNSSSGGTLTCNATAETLSLDLANQRVGIGTTAPNQLLELSAATNPFMRFNNSNTALTEGINLGTLEWYTNDVSTSGTGVVASIGIIAEMDFSNSKAAVGLQFFTKNGTTLAERVRIDNGGNVGIGTTAPLTKLDVSGGTGLTTGTMFNTSGFYTHATAETGNLATLIFTDSSTNASGTSFTNGLTIASTFSTSGAGIKEINDLKIGPPIVTACVTGACNWDGIEINTQTNTNALVTQNGINLVTSGTSTAGAINGVRIGNITAGTAVERAINIGTGWDYEGTFNDTTPTIQLAATDNTSVFNIVDSAATPNILFQLKDLSTNFGSAAIAGAFIERNSYFGEEFNNFRGTAATADCIQGRGDAGNPGTAACTAGTGGLTLDVTLGTAATASVTNLADTVNGIERMSGTSAIAGTAVVEEYVGSNAINNAQMNWAAANLPVYSAKIRTAVTPASLVRYYFGLSDMQTPAAGTPTNGIFFTNCSTAGGTPTCDGTIRGMIVSGGAIVGSVQACSASGTTQFGYYRFEVRSTGAGTGEVHFYHDADVSNGIVETECGTGVTGVTLPAAAMTVMQKLDSTNTTATTATLDIDYIRVWQDDSVDGGVVTASSTPPLAIENGGDANYDSSATLMALLDNVDEAKADGVDEQTTERLIAGVEVVTPKITTDTLFVGLIIADKIQAKQIEGLDIFTDKITSLSGQVEGLATASAGFQNNLAQGALTFEGKATFKEDTIFERLVTFVSNVVFKGEVSFESTPTFNADTAGYAKIHAGEQFVDVSFEKEYKVPPVVNATLTIPTVTQELFEKLVVSGDCTLPSTPADCQQKLTLQLMEQDIKYVITSTSTKGFIIQLNKLAPLDITFSWNSLAVTQPKTHERDVSSLLQINSAVPTVTPEAAQAATASASL